MWLCGKRNNKILGSTKRKDVGLEILLELFTWLLCTLRSPVLVTTTPEERGKSRDLGRRLCSAPHHTWVEELKAVCLLKEKIRSDLITVSQGQIWKKV